MDPLYRMYVALRARLLQRRRIRWFLVEARRRVYAIWAIWGRLIGSCPCCSVRSMQEAPAMVESAADSGTRAPAAQPIKSLEELSDRTLLLSPKHEFLKSSVPLTVNFRSKRPQLLVCHDFKGGYQEDKWVQGKEGMEGYVLWHWHLVDVFVYFSHSLVTIPPPGWINAAHKHGVPVLGTFITEWAHGASVCRSLLASADICCMYASRLAELAFEFGFDGWLINIENEVDMKDLPRLHLFVQHLRQCMQSQSPNSLVIWYDAVTEEGRLDWQNCLNEKNRFFFGDSDGLFTNYSWSEYMAESSANLAGERAPEVYMGVDVFGRNTFGGGGWNCNKALKVARKAKVSAALFAPGWVFETNQPPSFEVAQTRWWKTIQDCWPVGRFSPTRLPFFTDFNRGCGARVSVEGNVVSTQPWFNLSCQNLQPILKVTAQPQNSLEANMSHEAAYGGGSCLRISGSEDTLGLVLLYESYVPVKGNRFHVSHSVLELDNLNICLALHIQMDSSRFLVLLADEEAIIDVPPNLQSCVVKRSDPISESSGMWLVRKHILELGACTITQIHAAVYSHELDVQKLMSLFEDNNNQITSKLSTQENNFLNEVLLGHLRISTEPEHDRDLPKIVFEGCQSEWTQLSETSKSVSLTLRWGLLQSHVSNGNCQWVQYHVYVTKDEDSRGSSSVSRSDPEFLGVAVTQAFVVQDLLVPNSCNKLNFHVQAHCACGLPGALSPACSVDVSRSTYQDWGSGSDSSQLLLSEHAV
ncbi:hypothetical protein M758_4G094900 [Ceratodon purpureus]|nr:hypothetical protein M758_4G094900 [Ceratodon purpureus]